MGETHLDVDYGRFRGLTTALALSPADINSELNAPGKAGGLPGERLKGAMTA